VSDIDRLVQIANVFNPLREPALRSAIQALQLPPGSRGLDAGCGLGFQALLLAEAVGAAGYVTGLDLSPEILAYAQDMVDTAGLSERISFREGNVKELPFDDDTLDWAWSVDCVRDILCWRPALPPRLQGSPPLPSARSRSHTFCGRLAGSVRQAWRSARPEPLLATPMPR